MAKPTGKVALVTGASSGIGEATAERLAKAGYKVYGTSRRGAPAGKRSFEMLPLDVTSDESVEAAVSEVMRRDGRIDLLVNNAGFGVAPAGAEESSIDQARSIFETNFFGLVRMTRAVVPHMRRQGSGRIINIGSVLGFLPMPYGALYAATKHAVEGYSESLDHELRTRGIRVSVIEPAYTKTPFDANFMEPDAKLDEYREARAGVSKRVKEVMATAEPPGVVADTVLKRPPRRTRRSDTRPAGSRSACDCFADLRLPVWWMRGFERTCGLMSTASQPPAPRELSSDGAAGANVCCRHRSLTRQSLIWGHMRALVFKRYGGLDQVAFADIPRPVPKPDEILVQVHAAGLNPIDNMIPKGMFKPILRFQLPATLGSDLAGVVVEVGSRVTRFKPGDAVFASIFELTARALSLSLRSCLRTPPRSNRQIWTSCKRPRSRWSD